ELPELAPDRVGTLELQLAGETVGVDRTRVVAAEIDGRGAVTVDLPVEGVERARRRLAGKEGGLTRRRLHQLLCAAKVLAARTELRERDVELLLGRLPGVRTLLALLLVERNRSAVERAEDGVRLLLMAADDRTDRLREGLADRVAALEVVLAVRDAAGVVTAEPDAGSGRRGGAGGRRGARRRRRERARRAGGRRGRRAARGGRRRAGRGGGAGCRRRARRGDRGRRRCRGHARRRRGRADDGGRRGRRTDDGRRGGRRADDGGRRRVRVQRRRRGGRGAAGDRRVRAAGRRRAGVGGAGVPVVAVRRPAAHVAARVHRTGVTRLRELDDVVAARRTRYQTAALPEARARRLERDVARRQRRRERPGDGRRRPVRQDEEVPARGVPTGRLHLRAAVDDQRLARRDGVL